MTTYAASASPSTTSDIVRTSLVATLVGVGAASTLLNSPVATASAPQCGHDVARSDMWRRQSLHMTSPSDELATDRMPATKRPTLVGVNTLCVALIGTFSG